MTVTVSETGTFTPGIRAGVTVLIPLDDAVVPADESAAFNEIVAAQTALIAAIHKHYAVDGVPLRAIPHFDKFTVGPNDDLHMVVTVTADPES